MSDNPPHFAGVRRARTMTKESRIAKHRKLRGALFARAAVVALLLLPVAPGVVEAAYFSGKAATGKSDVFNHLRALGAGEQPQLTPRTDRSEANIMASFWRVFSIEEMAVADPNTAAPDGRLGVRSGMGVTIGGRGTGYPTNRYRAILHGINEEWITYTTAGNVLRCTVCTGPTDVPDDFFTVVPDLLVITQTAVGNDRQVGVRIVSPLQGPAYISSFYSDGTAVTFTRPPINADSWTIVVDGVETPSFTLSDDGLTATIEDATALPTTVTFSTSVTYRVHNSVSNPVPAARTVAFGLLASPEPVVNAGDDQIITDDAMSFELSGTVVRGGGDTSGAALNYQWTQVTTDSAAAAPVAMGAPNHITLSAAAGTPGENGVSTATFTVPNVAAPTRYYFALRGDAGGFSVTDTVVITVNDNDAPTVGTLAIAPDAAAGAPEGATATITASVVDADDDPGLRYQWAQTSPAPGGPGSPPVITFGSPTASATVLTYPDLGMRATQAFTLSFSVTDSQGLTATAATTLVVRDTEPPALNTPLSISPAVAATGAPEGGAATVGATASDPDGDTLTYQWRQTSPTSPGITFNSPTAANTGLTWPQLAAARSTQTFTVQVTVSDSVGLTAAAALSVVVHDTTPPTARAGGDLTVDPGAEVTLNAGASRNAAGDEGGITYAWLQVDADNSDTPAATPLALVALAAPTAATTTFTAPATPTTLHFRVTVSDEVTLASHADWVTITAEAVPVAPPAVSVGAALRVNEEATGLVLTGSVARAAEDNPSSTLSFEWVQVDSAAADAAQVAAGAANRVTATAIATTPDAAGVASATFTAPRATDRRGNGVRVITRDEYFFRLIGRSSLSGQPAEVSSATLKVTVYPPRGIYVSGRGFAGERIAERMDRFTITVHRRDGVQPAAGQIRVRSNTEGNTVVAPTPGEVPTDFRDRFNPGGSGSINVMLAGSNSVEFQHEVLSDSIPEDEEGVGFRYFIDGGCGGCQIEYAAGLVRNAAIQDDDTITVGWRETAVTVNEGDGAVTLTAVITSPASGQVIERSNFNLRYATADGTASSAADADFTAAAPTTFTLGAGTRSVDIPVALTDDEDIEPGAGKTFTVRISTATDTPLLTAIGAAEATVTIQDDDFPPPSLGITPNQTGFTEGGGNDAEFTITLTGGEFNRNVTVNFAVTGTGITTGDYDITAPGSLNAADSSGALMLTTHATDTANNPQTATVTLRITDDAVSEAAETLVLEVRTDIGVTGSASATIAESDPRMVTLSLDRAAAAEGSTPIFTVSLGGLSAAPVTVPLTIGGDAESGDFRLPGADPQQVVIAVGETEAEYPVGFVDDSLNEAAESVEITLGTPVAGAGAGTITLGSPAAATATIRQSDPVTVSIARIGAEEVRESQSARFTVALNGAAQGAEGIITATYTIGGDVTAGMNGDYTDSGGGGVALPAGTTEAVVSLPIRADRTAEGAEMLTVTLDGVQRESGVGAVTLDAGADSAGITIPANAAELYIIDYHPSGSQATTIAENAGDTTYTLVISPAPASGMVVMDWAVTATAAGGDVDISAADFTGGALPGGTLTFTPAELTQTVVVGLADDTLSEAQERFTIAYTITTDHADGAAAPGDLTVTVTDNDTARVQAVASGTTVVTEGDDPVLIIVDVAGGVTPTTPIEVDFTVRDSFSFGGVRRWLADLDDYIITGTGVTSMIDTSIREVGGGGPNRADGRTGSVTLNEANNYRAEVLFTPVDDNFVETVSASRLDQGFRFALSGAANAGGGGGTTVLSSNIQVDIVINDNDPITVNVVRADDVTEGGGATEAARIEFDGGVFEPYFQLDIEYSVSGCTTSGGCTVGPGTFNRTEGGADIYRHRISSRYAGGPAPVAATSVTVSLTADDNNLNEADRGITVAWVSAIGHLNGGDEVTAATSATLSIADDDNILVRITGGATVNEDAGSAALTVSMDHASRGDISVPLTAGGTASTADDVTGLPSQVVFAAGETSTQIAVMIADDNLNEAQETLTVSIGTPAGDNAAGRVAAHGSDNQATITINDNDPVEASITAAAATVEEGDAAVFNIRLNRASAAGVTIAYGISGVTAPTTPGTGDYTDSGMGSLVIPANANTATLSIPIRADATEEPAETLTVRLTAATGAGTVSVGAPATANVQIDASAASVRTLAVSGPAALDEGAAVSGVTTGTYTVTLTGDPFTSDTDVTWSVTHGGAEDADFANDSHNGGTVRFAANDSAAQTFMVGIRDDNLNEAAETFTLGIRVANPGADGGTGLPDPLPVAVTDDDVIEVTVDEVHADANRNEAANGGTPTTAVFSIALSGGVRTTTVTVPFGFSGDGITADDFNITVPANIAPDAFGGEVVFGAGGAPAADDTLFVRAELQDDDLNEASERLTLTAAAAGATGLRTAGGGAIRYAAADGATTGAVVMIDSDPIAIAIANAGADADDDTADFQVEEGRNARFAVTLNKASAAQVTVAYAISGDVVAADYTDSGGGALTIAAGSTAGEISIALTDDETDSATETLVVTLSAADSDHSAAGAIARSAATAEQSATQEVISRLAARTLRLQRYTGAAYDTVATAAAITEGDADTTLYFAVDFAGADDAVFTDATAITWTIEPAATNGASAADFTALSDAITHPRNARCTAAVAACRFRVVITGDNLNEPDEGFSVTLSVADEGIDGGTNPGDGSGALTITDDDPVAVTVTADTDVAEGGDAVLNVNLGAIPTQEVRIDYSASLRATAAAGDVDAALSGAGADLGAAGVITIAANASPPTGSLTIPVTDDNLNESAETFVLATDAGNITGAHGTPSVQGGATQTFTIAASDPMTAAIARTGADGVSEGGSATFRVTLGGAADGSAAAITVPYTIAGASGFTPTDAGGGSLTIAAGETSGVITVGIPNINTLGDADADQTLTVTLGASPTAGSGGGGVARSAVPGEQSATVQVEFSDAAHVFTLSSPATSIAETDSDANTRYTVTRTGPDINSGDVLVIDVSVVTGTATAADFSGGSLPTWSVSYGGATTSETFDIGIAGDNINEPNETFTIVFRIAPASQANADANGGVAVPNDLRVTINDDDVITYALGADAGADEGNPGGTAGVITLPVMLGGDIALGGPHHTIVVPFSVSGGTAGAGDYSVVPNNGLLSIDVRAGGALAADIVITAATDNLNEAAETVIITLGEAADRVTPASAGGGRIVRTTTVSSQSATATLNDDDGLSVRIARRAGRTGAVTEGDSAEFTASLVLARDDSVAGAAAADICVTFGTAISTQSNTAAGAAANTVPNADVEVRDCTGNVITTDAQGAASNGGALIPAGQSEAHFSILARYDDLDEGMTDEELTVTITAAAHRPALTGAAAPTIDGGNNQVSVNIENINEDIVPPRFDDPANQPGWSGGQQVLWVRMDEDFKVLPHPAGADGATVSTATPSLATPNALPAGDFTVVENHGNPSSATIAVEGVTPFADVRALRLELQRAIAANAANVNVIYERTGGANAIYDIAVEEGLARNNMRNATTRATTGPLTPSATNDFDTDGIPDAVEAGIRGAAGNPLVAVTAAQQPAFNIARTTPTTSTVAYSGIRRHGVRAHLGVSTVETDSATQTRAATITAYYRSDTFGYDGTYQCAGANPFPANYDAPLADGGCAPVDWGDIVPGEDHTIAWLARSADGVWALDTATDSNLPQMAIHRIPELNMASQTLFTTGASVVVIRAFFDDTPATGLTLELSRTPDETGETTMVQGSGAGRTLAATDTSPVSALWAITGLTESGGVSRLYVPNTPTAGFSPNYPAATDHSLGLARQTRVLHTGGAPVPPVLGRPVVRLGGNPVLALVEGNADSYTLDLPVENHDAIGAANAADAATATHNETLDIGTVAFVAASGDDGDRYRYTFTMRGGLLATTMTQAVIRATITGGLGGSATAVLRYPVVASGVPLATARADADGDGIADEFDEFDARAHLPVVVSDDPQCRDTGCAGASAWHHIRPALPMHDLRLGETTAERLARAGATGADNYAEYSASSVPADTGLAAVYDFEIGGVDYAQVSADARTGGVAGVIIPLPESLAGSGASLVKHPSGRAFSVAGGNDYGFAMRQEDGACPDDTMAAGSPYREGETLRRAKRGDDACLVVYIVDGGANDEDGLANGVIKDPLGVRPGNAGGIRRTGGALGPAALTALLLLALLLALLPSPPTRTPRRRRPAH